MSRQGQRSSLDSRQLAAASVQRYIHAGPPVPFDEEIVFMQDNTASKPEEADWRELLTLEQFYVTGGHGAECAFSHPYQEEERPGSCRCVCCGDPLFGSDDQFD